METALAEALKLAAQAQQWDMVAELAARRVARSAPGVVVALSAPVDSNAEARAGSGGVFSIGTEATLPRRRS